MYLTDYDNEKGHNPQNEKYVPDHVLFRQVNSKIISVLSGEKQHSANKIFRDEKWIGIAVRCNCGHNHPLFQNKRGFRAKWSVSLCDKTVNFLIKKETVYQDEIGRRIWIQMD